MTRAPKRTTTAQPGRTITLDYQEMPDSRLLFCVVEWKHTGVETYHYRKTFTNYNEGLQLMSYIPPELPQPIAEWVQENLPPADDEGFGKWMSKGHDKPPEGDDDGKDIRGSGRRE